MLPVSAISDAAVKLRNLLSGSITDLEATEIRIGHPKETLAVMQEDKNHLNLFFYSVNYDGYPADGLSSNPMYVRLHCLITAVGAKANGSPSVGENDLRLIGEVMRVLHEQPVVILDGGTGNKVASLEIVPHPLNLDNLNHIWSTQGDTAYRLSVAYEMALAPIPLAREVEPGPRAGELNVLAWGDMERPMEKEKLGLRSEKPEVVYLEVDTRRGDWVPHICLVENAAGDDAKLHYVFKVTGDLSNTLDILIAGREGGELQLYWSIWRRKTDNSIEAWKHDILDEEAPQTKELKNPANATEEFFPQRIDPDNIDSRRIFQVKLPVDVGATETKNWQAMLVAVQNWEHEDQQGSGNMKKTSIKSNTILLYGG